MNRIELATDIIETLSYLFPDVEQIDLDICNDDDAAAQMIQQGFGHYLIEISRDMMESYGDWEFTKKICHELIHVIQVENGADFNELTEEAFDPENLEYWTCEYEMQAFALEGALAMGYYKVKRK